MSPARVAKPSSSTRAPSLASAVVMRATISSSAIGAPRDAALLPPLRPRSCSISGSGMRVAAAGRVVLVPAGAGLLAVAPHLEQPIRDRRLRPLRARLADRLQVLPDARADVDAGDVLHAERADRQAELGQHACRSARRSRLLRAAGTPRACSRRASGWRRTRSSCRRRRRPCRAASPSFSDVAIDLLAGLAAADDLEQLHHVRRAEEVVAEHLRRPAARLRELVDVERRRSSTRGCSRAASPCRARRTSPSSGPCSRTPPRRRCRPGRSRRSWSSA